MIDHDQVKKIASLSRLELTDEEVAEQSEQLCKIVAMMDDLLKVDTEGVAPTNHVMGIENVFRGDEVKPSMPIEDVLANAPESEENMFLVPKIV